MGKRLVTSRHFTVAESVSLKEYIESRIIAMDKALEVASAQLNQRLEGMNEFRAQLSGQAQTFLPREEYRIQHEALDAKLVAAQRLCLEKYEALEKRVQNTELLKADVQGRIWATAVVVTLALAGIQIVIHVFMAAK